MPEISRFQGIVVSIFIECGERHHTPHFHAFYQDMAASFRIDPVELLEGDLPLRQRRLVEAWAELHQAELMENWQSVYNYGPARKIEPLR